MNEYIVTCRSYEDLENLYDDMETPGGNLYIPNREVELVHRRAISRNTHYMLTEEEAVEVRNDPRVIACERPASQRGIKPVFMWEQTADFQKTTGLFASSDKNWGLWRVINGQTYFDTATYDVTVTAPNSSYYTLSGTDRNGAVSGNNATVTINVGDTINFNLSNVSGVHPFRIRVSSGGADVSTPGAINQGGTGNTTVSWTPNTAGTFYYQCSSHSAMLGTITVNAATTTWGNNSTSRISNQTILTTSSGRNVDVVVVDAHVNPDHPEFTENADGTGSSRVNQFNWFSYSSTLGYTTPATYTYSTSGASPNENHGTHVAGTVAGNSQGWARDANIYNMAFSDSLSGVTDWDEKLWDYLRYFHQNKSVNPATGRRNPTVTNHSWGYSYGGNFGLTSFTSARINGTVTDVSSYTTTEKKEFLENNGYYPCAGGTSIYKPVARVASVDADLQDAISEGVIVISSAGNNYAPIVREGSDDYDNYMIFSGTTYYFWRGTTPGSANNVICVGSLDSRTEEGKSNFSNWGPRVDIFAPGSDIISSVYDYTSAVAEGYGSVVADPRDGSYWLASINGTSMAAPQVAGVVACLAEQQPNMTQAEALQFLTETCKTNIGIDGTGTTSPYRGITSAYNNLDSDNRYLFYLQKRKSTGTIQNTLFGNRDSDTSGVKYPRRNIRVTK